MAEEEANAKRRSRARGVAPPRRVKPIASGGEDVSGFLEKIGLAGLSERTRGAHGESKDTVITCRIPASDLEAIDTLIEAGIRTTRSDAAAWLIRAGLEANRGLLEKVASTVAEIRRLREQARTLADSTVITEEEPT